MTNPSKKTFPVSDKWWP